MSKEVRSTHSADAVEESREVELEAFDLTVAGLVVGEKGPVDHSVSFNAFRVLEENLRAGGQPADIAELVHDAQRIVHDQQRIGQAIAMKTKNDAVRRRWSVVFERAKSSQR